MKNIYIGFALLLFGNIIANIGNDLYLCLAILIGIIGGIVFAVGIVKEYGVKETSSPSSVKTDDETKKTQTNDENIGHS